MAKVPFEISMSLDGFIAGPDATLERPLGRGGERLHEWARAAAGVIDSPAVTHLRYRVRPLAT